jgi:hypothetical protein
MRRTSPSEPPLLLGPEDLEIETTDGRRPSTTAGDRMMVGLAVVALLGGLLIAITNALPDTPAETSQATASARPSRTPSPTPTPPPLRTVEVAARPLPTPVATDPVYSGWVRALEDVALLNAPVHGASPSGTLRRGQAAWADQVISQLDGEAAWMQISGDKSGWMEPEVDGRAVVKRYSGGHRMSQSIETLLAGGDRFAGIGYAFTPNGIGSPFIVDSVDGADWSRARIPEGANGCCIQLAHGPAGWLLGSAVDDDRGELGRWMWRSADLRHWQLLGAMSEMQDGYEAQLVGSEAGYVAIMSGRGLGYGTNGQTVWYSADGLLWSERPVQAQPSEGGSSFLVATPIGFYLQSQGAGAGTVAAFSTDGWTWSDVSDDPVDFAIGVVAAGEQLIAIGRSDGGDTRPWIGTITEGELSWHEDLAAGTAFIDAVVTSVVSDGRRPMAFGRQLGTDEPMWWTREDGYWQRHQLPAEFGDFPHVAAGAAGGYVLLESRVSAVGQNPRFWHLSDADEWEPEQAPVIEPQGPPTAAECGEPPSDALELMATDGLWLAECNGARPLTFRAWAAVCDGCYGGGDGTYTVEWLSQPLDNHLFLSPIMTGDWGWIEGVLPPSIDRDPDWQERWLKVTGHFDDPAAARCRWQPTPDEEQWYGGRAQMIDQCRSRFVITDVRVLRGS